MSENDDLIEGAPVPSMGSLFDDPESTPPVVAARPAGSEGGRLYRSAYAAGPAAALAVQALPRPRPVDESLPLSPEAVAAEAASAPAPAEPAVVSADESPEVDAGAAAVPVTESPASAVPVAAEPAATPADAPVLPAADEVPAIPVVAASAAVAAAEAEPPVVEAPPAVAAASAADGPVSLPVVAVATPAPVEAQAWPAEPAAIEPELAAPLAVQPAAPAPAVLALTVAEPVEKRGLPWLTWTQATVVMIGVTVVAAIVDVLLRNGIGAVTGLGLLASTIVCGLRLRREDIWAAVVVPPLAFLAALVTVGQFAIGSTGGFVSRQALNIVTGLSLNAPWILGATAAGLVIVLVRRHREGPAAVDTGASADDSAGQAQPPVTTG